MLTNHQIKRIYPLSPLQEGMFFHYLINNKSNVYFEQSIYAIQGKIDADLFERSIRLLVARYDILRTIFVYEKLNRPCQVVLKNRSIKVDYRDISHLETDQQDSLIAELQVKDRERGFDLTKDILIRFTLLKINSLRYKLIWSFHHILLDGWSVGIILTDLFITYQALNANRPVRLEEENPYFNYIQWLEKQNREEGYAYWREYLEDYQQQALIPGKGTQSPPNEYQPGKIVFPVNGRTTEQLTVLARRYNVTINTIFQTIWGILLQNYNNTDDVVFGNVVSGRSAQIPGVETAVGLFINAIPLRIRNGATLGFGELIKRVYEEFRLAERYSYLSLAQIQSNSTLRNELFDHIMAFENYPLDPEKMDDLSREFQVEWIDSFARTNYDLAVSITPGDPYEVQFSFNAAVYPETIINRVKEHYIHLLEQVVGDPEIQLAKLELLDGEEKRRILFDFNHTDVPYDAAKTIPQLFEEQVARRPDANAVVFGRRQLTYRELNRQANQLAGKLIAMGVQPDTIVAIMVERSLEMIVGILAILKAGGAYLPLDPGYPDERLKYMLFDSKAAILLTRGQLIAGMDFMGAVVDLDNPELFQGAGVNVGRSSKPDNLAYVIYTSGSTGKPKGVLLEHRGIANLKVYFENQLRIREDDRVIQFAPFSFDASVWEMSMSLLLGGSLYMVPKELFNDPRQFEDFINQNQITVVTLPPPYLTNLDPNRIQSLRLLVSAGSAANPDLVNIWKDKLEYINAYGPTETTICASFWRPGADRFTDSPVPIGKPITNMKIYILDSQRRPVPIGASGEICVAGVGLARGYIGHSELTGEKFVSNPFIPDTLMYRTGDLGRWKPDGNVDFLGRIDHQVKIRGFRIEAGEIESCLLRRRDIKAAVVIADQDSDGNQYLVAYLVSPAEMAIESLREDLAKELPDYMIPSFFVFLDRLPLTPNGKVDRKALPARRRTLTAQREYEAPTNEVESKLAEVWQTVLQVDRVGRNDNFFELGGHSLNAIQIIAKAQTVGFDIPISALFRYQKIRDLAEYLLKIKPEKEERITDITQVGNLIKKEFGLSGMMVEFEKSGTKYYVLYIQEAKLVKGELADFVSANFDETIYPHYIQCLPERELVRLSNHEVGLDGLPPFNQEHEDFIEHSGELLAKIDQMQDDFENLVLKNTIVNESIIAPVQQYHLINRQTSGTVLRLERVEPLRIRQAVLHLVKTEELLRSRLFEKENCLLWQEIQAPEGIIVPEIDLSEYNLSAKERILEHILPNVHGKEFRVPNRLMYRILLIRENLRDVILLFSCSHVIFDFMSSEMIQNVILDYCHSTPTVRKNGNYWEYIRQIRKGPQGIDDCQLVQRFRLDEIDMYTNVLAATILKKEEGRLEFSHSIPIEQLNDCHSSGLEKSWRFCFLLAQGFFSRYFDMDRVPIWILNYGRAYQKKEYYNMIGEFIDLVPTIYESNQNDIPVLEGKIRAKNALASEHNINFFNLAFNEEMSENYPQSSSYLRKLLSKPCILFNYLGMHTEKGKEFMDPVRWERNIERPGNNINQIGFTAFYAADRIHMKISLPFQEDESKLKLIIASELSDVANQFKGLSKLLGGPVHGAIRQTI